MLVIIGFVVVLISVIGGYIMEHGNLSVLFQPAEIVIIIGAALGSFLIASPAQVVKCTVQGIREALGKGENPQEFYIKTLQLLFDLLNILRKDGAVVLEDHINKPNKSPVFMRFPEIVDNAPVRDFICDNFKIMFAGKVESYEFDELLSIDIESRQNQSTVGAQALNKVADALPGLGIVAAVLGVVVTMGKINEPPEVLGHSVGAALVGTFLGILCCYGFVGPMATKMEHLASEKMVRMSIVQATLSASIKGMSPILAVESGRRAIPDQDRPSFDELEKHIKMNRKAG